MGQKLVEELENRILVLDGAMGTMIQMRELEEEDFQGDEFQNPTKPLQGRVISVVEFPREGYKTRKFVVFCELRSQLSKSGKI